MTATPGEQAMVHVVDDDESFRKAIARLLKAAGYDVQLYASAGEFALKRDQGETGCILLDVRMPGPSGMDLQASLRREGSALPIIFLTGHGDIATSVRAMKSGAVDFLTKPVQRADLLAAISAALEVGASTRTARAHRREYQKRAATLTPREQEVLARVAAGQPNKQIAAELDIAERTVKAHRGEVMRKLGARSLAELVRIADEVRFPGDAPAQKLREVAPAGTST